VAEKNPPLFVSLSTVYDGSDLGVPFRDLFFEGAMGAGDLVVGQRAAGANLSVDIAAGTVWVQGDEDAQQPCYRCVNDATVNLAISAAHATLARKDIVVAEVLDAEFSGASRLWRLRVVAGTPLASPAEPAVGNNAVKLALIDVPAADTTISTAQITDRRVRAQHRPQPPKLTAAQFMLLGAAIANHPVPSSFEGYRVVLEADAANQVYWDLRYRDAAATYKWECLGGGSLQSVNETAAAATSTSYADTAQPVSVAVPLVGVYNARLDCGMSQTSDSDTGNIVLTDLGNAILTADPWIVANIGKTIVASREGRVVVSDAGNKGVKMRSKVSVGTQVNTMTRKTLTVRPVAVGIT
jgi:hypothetical protein